MKKLLKKLAAIVMMVVLITGVMPIMGLEGVFFFNPVKVEAAEDDAFDTSKHIVTQSGKYKGAAWTMYDNGLLWVEDDTSGETSYESFGFGLQDLQKGFDFSGTDIKYLYWNITAPSECDRAFCSSSLIGIKFGEVFINSSSNITNMEHMFEYCGNLEILDVSQLDTSNVTNMTAMFRGCNALKSLDISNFDGSKNLYTYQMFDGCVSLESLNLGEFDTSQVFRMSYMFDGCKSLKSLDVSSFDTSRATHFNYMFGDCSSLTSLDVSGFDISKAVGIQGMFTGCTGLTSLDVSNFDTGNLIDMSYVFRNCKSLTSLDVSGFDTSNVANFMGTFEGCSSLTKLDVSKFNTSKTEDMINMFKGCSSLTDIDVSGFNTSKVNRVKDMFYGCSSLTALDLSNFAGSVFDEADYTGLYEDMLTGCTLLHMIKCPNIEANHDVGIDGRWYKLTANHTIDRTVRYTTLPAAMHSETIVRELTHKCDNVTDGVGICSLCGCSILYGDCDDDGQISTIDAVEFKKYLAGDDASEINLGAADVDTDYIIEVADAVKLMKYLAGMDVELGVND